MNLFCFVEIVSNTEGDEESNSYFLTLILTLIIIAVIKMLHMLLMPIASVCR